MENEAPTVAMPHDFFSDQERRDSAHSCPFAVSLEDDEASHNSSDFLQIARKSCPAFSDNHCPFAKARNADDIRKTFDQIPASHFSEDNSLFRKALVLFQSLTIQESEETPQFLQVMDEFSSATVMSLIARKLEEVDGGMVGSDGTSKPTSPSNRDDLISHALLSEAFKQGTAEAHEAAENVHFVKNFIAGDIDRDLYADLVLSLYHVYRTMEELLNEYALRHFGACHFPLRLSRTKALEEDVDFWHGCDQPSTKEMTPATRDYVNRLKDIASKQPLLLLAHAYTRYLGDLSGGKILARVARRAMNLDKDGEGLAFYSFEKIPSEKRFKDMYRESMDALSLDQSQIQSLVQEANVAFLLNMRIFEELDVKANIPGSTVRPLTDVLAYKVKRGSTTVKASDECPFLAKKKQQTQDNTLGELHMKEATKGRCPWPFVFFHDPVTGLKDYKTWVLIGLLLSWLWASYL
mmetsp:Transcript_15763/g.23201  ORF Transcript_15763/g.23201 Transcript_15763/m.23201 type:complete len:465 (+) Transcript_15763:90-1484(+)